MKKFIFSCFLVLLLSVIFVEVPASAELPYTDTVVTVLEFDETAEVHMLPAEVRTEFRYTSMGEVIRGPDPPILNSSSYHLNNTFFNYYKSPNLSLIPYRQIQLE